MALFLQRPPTAKPKDPSSYEFNDAQLEKDYCKMYEKYTQLEEMLKENPQLELKEHNMDETTPMKKNESNEEQDGVYNWWKKK